MSRALRLVLNGAEREFAVEDWTLLLDLLRAVGLSGAKPSCEMEVCGSCTVLVEGLPVSSCTTLAREAEGKSVETVEGLAGDTPHPLQQAFMDRFAFQCGYCTPGMLMAAKSLLQHQPHPSREEIVHWMDGNICRCTGYQSIVEAIELAAQRTT
ncbi:MAG TPA: (2Fe-2S)-binding protein [Candidatus Nitrosotalea sp.]|nr:(2Fe-2S)-binding protein [Candidatus Nitrosotalea sp.]